MICRPASLNLFHSSFKQHRKQHQMIKQQLLECVMQKCCLNKLERSIALLNSASLSKQYLGEASLPHLSRLRECMSICPQLSAIHASEACSCVHLCTVLLHALCSIHRPYVHGMMYQCCRSLQSISFMLSVSPAFFVQTSVYYMPPALHGRD